MEWTISTDPALVQLELVHGWLARSYWSPNIRRDVFATAFANSLVAGAYAGSRQLGVARVVTDQATFAWLADVYVADDVRGRGIARALVRTLMEDPRTQTLRRWLLGTRDAHGVYSALGFSAVDPTVFMQHSPDPARWTAV